MDNPAGKPDGWMDKALSTRLPAEIVPRHPELHTKIKKIFLLRLRPCPNFREFSSKPPASL
jgi:hypothetical protein